MIAFLKNIAAIIYLFYFNLFRKRKISDEKNLLFINTEQLGDVIVSSMLMNDDNYFIDYDNVYFLIREEYFDLFKSYKDKVKLITFNKNLFLKSFSYRNKFINHLNDLHISCAINISPARGFINEFLTHMHNCSSFVFYHSVNHLGKTFKSYWDKKYTALLFPDIRNDYLCTQYLLKDVFGVEKLQESFFKNVTNEFENQKPYIVISPYTTNPIKDWNIENYRKIIEKFSGNYKIFILHSKTQSAQLKKDFGRLKNVFIDYIPLSSVPALLKDCAFYLGGDTGISHLANIMNIKSYVVSGGGGFKKSFSGSYGENSHLFFTTLACFDCGWRCTQEKPFCHQNINSDMVVTEILKSF